MDKRQKVVLCIGALLFVIMGLFPPRPQRCIQPVLLRGAHYGIL